MSWGAGGRRGALARWSACATALVTLATCSHLANDPALAGRAHLAYASTPSQPTDPPPIFRDPSALLPSLRERAARHDQLQARRLDLLLPALMREHGVDLWIVTGREYNEDPVLATMLPATWLSARRRTTLLLHDRGAEQGVERLAVSRYAIGNLFEAAWDPDSQPDQWARLAELVSARNPRHIALNSSSTFAHADGISHSEHAALTAALGPQLSARLVSGEGLAVDWLQTRISDELPLYRALCAQAHAILAEGLSNRAITPGTTTTEDLAWWFRERFAALQLDTWFQPDVSVQRATDGAHPGSFADDQEEVVIQPGDLVHVDLGITAMGLNTDTQQHAYVLRPGESAPPAGLLAGLVAGKRLQDILMQEYAVGRTGNQVLAAALQRARAEGLRPTIYTHPLGLHGHGAGPSIGMWDKQAGVPGSGDARLREDTVWAIELNVAVDVPEWAGQTVRIMLEEDALFADGKVAFLDGRQEAFHLVR